MAYFKARLKINGDKASPYFRPFEQKMHLTDLYLRTLNIGLV